MIGYSFTIGLVNALAVITMLFVPVILYVWIRRKGPPQLVWATSLSCLTSFIYFLVSLGLDILGERGSTTCESLSSIVKGPASSLIGWMAYRGTALIDEPLTADQILVLKCGAVLWFWVPFIAIVLFIAIVRAKRKRVINGS